MQQATVVQFRNLEAMGSNWALVNDKTVNPVQVDSLVANHLKTALELVMNSSQPYGGALMTNKNPFPDVGVPLTYVGVDFQFLLPEDAVEFLRCLELDLKICVRPATNPPTPNVIDMSAQFELFRNGQFQIDQAGTWADTPFAAGSFAPNTWIPVSYRGTWDPQHFTFSFTSMSINGGQNQIPESMQNQPMLATNWNPVVACQLQLDNNDKASAIVAEYTAITVTLSSQPF